MRRKTHARRTHRPKTAVRQIHTLMLIPIAVIIAVSGSAYLGLRHYLGKNAHSIPSIVLTQDSLPTRPAVTVPPPLASPTLTHDYTIPPVQNSMVPVINRIPTSEPVVFLTIDDGITQLPGDLADMQANHDVATFFLVYRFIKNDPAYFATLSQGTGSDIENHTYDHFLLTNLTYAQQQQDICLGATVLTTLYNHKPQIFRPSGGAYNSDTQKAAAACGMRALITWDAAINNGVIRYQSGNHLRPGDIVLMHFRATFTEDMGAFVAAEKEAGLHTDLLVNWLPPTN